MLRMEGGLITTFDAADFASLPFSIVVNGRQARAVVSENTISLERGGQTADQWPILVEGTSSMDRAVSEIEAVLMLQAYEEGEWRPPVFKTEAARGTGVTALLDAVEMFAERHDHEGDRMRSRAEVRLREALSHQFVSRLERHEEIRAAIEDAVQRITRRDVDPYTAAAEIMERSG